MRQALLLSLLLVCVITAFGQQPKPLKPCATPTGKSAWLTKYQQNPGNFTKNLDSILYIPLTIHVVGNNAGSGFFSLDNVVDALCTVNNDFAPANIQFYIKDDIRYLKNSAYYRHEEIVEGAAMMFTENIPNTINCYIVDNPAGNAGYNLPYAGIALSKLYTSPFDHTWTHELGHAFSLPHTFLGWEGGISYSDTLGLVHGFNNPAPTEVYYDYTLFKDSIILDTVIIDTALVELVDGSNCAIAADGFCDTPPDYLAFRWNCTGTTSPNEQTDPTGSKFRSDGTFYMSYADDGCQDKFSDEQIAAMRANIFDTKSNLLNQDTIGGQIPPTLPILLVPNAEETVNFQDIQFEWLAAPGAEQYVFQLSRLPSLGFPEVDTVITGNSITIPELRNDRKFYWRIRPFSRYSFCTSYSEVQSFETATLTNVATLENMTDLKIFPNPAASQQPIQITFERLAIVHSKLTIQIWNVNGQLVWEKTVLNVLPTMQINPQLPAGFYTVHINQDEQQLIKKLVVH